MWQETDDSLYRKFKLDSFEEAISFINKVADAAAMMDHHPKIINNYNTVEFWLSTHSAGGKVTDKDKKLAGQIDNIAAKINEKNEFILCTDGGARGNPGPAAIGYVIYNLSGDVVKKHGESIGTTTNNQAEYKALIAGLEGCLELGADILTVKMDSELIVRQLQGKYKVKDANLKPLHGQVISLADKFKKINFHHIKREQNKEADSLVNQALDRASS